MTQPDRADRL